MNIEEYISSGVVEAYVLGLATETEVQEIRQLMERYPELRAAVQEQEDMLARYADQYAVPPPAGMRQTIWEALSNEQVLDEARPTIMEPVLQAGKATPIQKRAWVSYAMAASLALLVASIAANIALMNNNKNKDAVIAGLHRSRQLAEQDKNEALATAEKAKQQLKVLTLPQLVKVTLAGVGSHSGHSAMLYWDKASGDVFLDLKGMPQAPSGKQYQLWAIIDGKPVNAGMYSLSEPMTIVQMKTIARAEMFAITIENKGGSPVPTLEQMVVAGKTS